MTIYLRDVNVYVLSILMFCSLLVLSYVLIFLFVLSLSSFTNSYDDSLLMISGVCLNKFLWFWCPVNHQKFY